MNQIDQTSPRRATRRRAPFVALALVVATLGAACSPSPNGGIDLAIGGTVALPPISAGSTPQQVLGCVYYNSPGVTINGATATIPGVNINLNGVITVPNVQVNLPAVTVSLGSIDVCGNIGNLPAISLPVSVVATGQLNLATSQLTLSGVVITTYIDLFGLAQIPINIPLDPIVVNL